MVDMSWTSKSEASLLERVEAGQNEGPVFGSPLLRMAAVVLYTFGGDRGRESLRVMAERVVQALGDAGCRAEIYVAFREDGTSSTGDVSSPQLLVTHRPNGGLTGAALVPANDYDVLAP